jgi:hypothetical protein
MVYDDSLKNDHVESQTKYSCNNSTVFHDFLMMSYSSRKKPSHVVPLFEWTMDRSSPRGIATSLLYRRRIEEFSQLVVTGNHGMDYEWIMMVNHGS